jgi:hypothetical protein
VLLPEDLGLLPLLRSEDGVELVPGAGNNRVQARLYLASYAAHLPHLTIHDRVDPDLLIVGQAEIVSESVPEFVVRGWRPTPVVMPEARTAEHVRQEQQAVYRDTGQAAGQGNEQQHQGGDHPPSP